MKKNIDLTLLIENWKNFINDKDIIEEKLGKYDVTHAEEFVKNHVNSDRTANFMHSMIMSSIDFYEKSLNLEVSNTDLRNVSKQALGDRNAVITDESTVDIIKSFKEILIVLEEKYNISNEDNKNKE